MAPTGIAYRKIRPPSPRCTTASTAKIDAATSEAKLEHGVLTLKLVKKVPVSNAAELTIQ